ncbi:small GTPase RAB, putative [Entamoeba dispar SAW760]|uniref:Small GTPase RAB, putative n=1 Tax=Entamoeba dispar (strain ATCC PRA-260 / SAW760) TaxID=370354 RepID=B0EJ92_ENTDS|nr:small GTPase RAB, putative [Entamoeba dispar SAW760]EDR25400.1 small GTPase RAB, putative [Entamoeba dispar SAW760]|eukprot:EDR25400.1 small GTPase RAB, putative [Entamoeba dispar SAW760]
MQSSQDAVKIVVIGDQSVGKTCISGRLVDGSFKPDEKSTIGASFVTTYLPIDGNNVKIVIWDTAGQEKYRSMVGMYYRGATVALICYDITSRSSFESLEGWYTDLMKVASSDISVAIVGNKTDLESTRVVQTTEGQSFADQHSALFFEVSAKTGQNVTELFVEATKRSKIPTISSNGTSQDNVNVSNPVNPQPSKRRYCLIF